MRAEVIVKGRSWNKGRVEKRFELRYVPEHSLVHFYIYGEPDLLGQLAFSGLVVHAFVDTTAESVAREILKQGYGKQLPDS
jgi:hypothetical protein